MTTTTQLRALIRKYGDLGYAIAGLYLLGHYLLVRQRVRTLTALFTTLAITCWATRGMWHNQKIPLDDPIRATAAYTVTEVKMPSSALYSIPIAVNSEGQVIVEAFMQDYSIRALLWQNGKVKDLGNLGEPFTIPGGINDKGEVVGLGITPDGYFHAFLWQNGKMKDLSPGEEDFNAAYGVNNRGDVAGWTFTDSDELHAVVWKDGKMKDMGTLPGDEFSMAAAINNNGQAVGYSAGRTAIRPFISQGDSLQPLPFPGKFGLAFAVNDSGQAVGLCDAAKESFHAFLSQDRKSSDLGTLGGGNSTAVGISADGQVVGWSETASGDDRVFLWRKGKMIDLTSQLDAKSGWTLHFAYGVSRRGHVVGTGYQDGKFRSFLLTPNG